MADKRLQVFHAVAKQMSFTKAAEVLFMPQPAVTLQIKLVLPREEFRSRLVNTFIEFARQTPQNPGR